MNVHFDGFRKDGLAYLDDEQAAALRNVEVRAGDVLLNITGASIGRVAVAPTHMHGARVNQHVCIIRPDSRLDSSFLRWHLASPRQQRLINSVESGATRQALTKEKILGFEVPLPSLDEQRATVAEIEKQFSRLDEAVAGLQRVKANLKRYKAAVLKSAVTGRLVPTEAELARREGRSYETGAELLQRILEARRSQWQGKGKYKEPAAPDTTGLPELPEGWVWASAVQVCDPVVDCHNKTAPYTASGIPLVRTTNIRDGRLVLEDVRFVDQPTYEFWSRRCPPEPGDVLFTREAPMGEAGIIPPGVRLCLGQRTMLMRPSPAISASFLLAALLSPVVRTLIERVAVGSGVKHLRVGDVEILPIPMPPHAEQQRIVAEVDRLISIAREQEELIQQSLVRSEAFRRSLLAKCFSVSSAPASRRMIP
jgi:type I restriction enzyme S subunit